MGVPLEMGEPLSAKAEAQTASIIDKTDLLFCLWRNQTGKSHGSGASECSRRAESESTASPRLMEDDSPSELRWNPLDLHRRDSPADKDIKDGEGATLDWDPLGLAETDTFKLLENNSVHEDTAPYSGRLLLKPPGLEDCGEGNDAVSHWSRSTTAGNDSVSQWSRSTTAGTADPADLDGRANELLASEMAAILDLIHTGQCVAPWVPEAKPRKSAVAPVLPQVPEVRGSPYWPCPGSMYFTVPPAQLHNFCPWCGSARVCFHRFCPQCGVMYPDLTTDSHVNLE